MNDKTEVLFLDAAGTLFQVAEPVGVTYARLAARHGIHVEAAAMDHAFRCTWKELSPPLHPDGQRSDDDDRSWWRNLVGLSFEKVLGDPLDESRLEDVFSVMYDHFAQASAWELYDEVPELLRALQGKLRLFVVSNFDRRLHRILEGFEIAAHFEGVILSSEVGASKPDRRMYAAALKAAGTPASRCFHIGDEEKADFQGPRAAGIPAMHLKRPEMNLLDVAEKVLSGAFSCLHEPWK